MQQAVIVVRFCKNERDYQHQLDELKAIAQSRSFQVSAEIVKTLQEPTGLDRLLNLSRQGQIQHVLIRELSCLGLSTDEIRYMITELTASGVNIYIQSLGIELLRNGKPTPAATPLLTLLNELSVLELEVLSQRISICAQRSRHASTRNSPLQPAVSAVYLKKYPAVVRNLRAGFSIRKTAKRCAISINTVRKVSAYLFD